MFADFLQLCFEGWMFADFLQLCFEVWMFVDFLQLCLRFGCLWTFYNSVNHQLSIFFIGAHIEFFNSCPEFSMSGHRLFTYYNATDKVLHPMFRIFIYANAPAHAAHTQRRRIPITQLQVVTEWSQR